MLPNRRLERAERDIAALRQELARAVQTIRYLEADSEALRHAFQKACPEIDLSIPLTSVVGLLQR